MGDGYTADDHAAHCASLLRQVEHAIRARGRDRVSLHDLGVVGRVTAEAIASAIPLPPFDNSQMDGYAVRAADLAGASAAAPVVLRIGVATAAGDAPVAHAAGSASPVMTGAPIPTGADAVVPIEEALPPVFPALARAGKGEPRGEVGFVAPVEAGRFVRGTGSDLARGAEILPAGSRLTPARVGALAAAGLSEVGVFSRVRVLLCATGDELIVGTDPEGGIGTYGAQSCALHQAPWSELGPGRIHDANTPMLAAAIRATGAEVQVLSVADDVEAFREALAACDADVIVTTGGVSEGAFEVVREALTPLGVEFGKVAMQPGGPQGSGMLDLTDNAGGARRAPVLCFPGNPVSAMLSAELFLLPSLRRLAGLPAERPRETRLLAHDTDSPPAKLQLRRGRIEADGRVRLSGPSSHLLAGLATADVIAKIPIGVDHLVEGSPVTTWRIND